MNIVSIWHNAYGWLLCGSLASFLHFGLDGIQCPAKHVLCYHYVYIVYVAAICVIMNIVYYYVFCNVVK
jgi:hypothetical protein